MLKIGSFLIIICALFLAYKPATEGYYIYSDDYWTYLDRGKPIGSNDSFRSQAIFAGRPLGALFDYAVFLPINRIEYANHGRLFSIFLLSVACFLLYLSFVEAGSEVSRTSALLMSISIFTLPAFRSNIISLFEVNGILTLVFSIAASLICLRMLKDKERRITVRSLFAPYFLMTLAPLTYTNASTFFWAPMLYWLLSTKPSDLPNKLRRFLLFFSLPMLGMITYLGVYNIFLRQETAYSLIAPDAHSIANNLLSISQAILPHVSLWLVPHIDDRYKLIPQTMFISCVCFVVLVGFVLQLRKEFADAGASKIFLCSAIIAKYTLVLAVLVVSVAPMMLSSLDLKLKLYLNLRRFQTLQASIAILFLWALCALVSSVFPRNNAIVGKILFAAIAIFGLCLANYDVKYSFVVPLSAELKYMKNILKESFIQEETQLVHIVVPGRTSTRIDSTGLMSQSRAWVPGMVVSVVRDIAQKNVLLRDQLSKWTLGYAEDHVTSSTKEEMVEGCVVVDLPKATIVDLSSIESQIRSSVILKRQSFCSQSVHDFSPVKKNFQYINLATYSDGKPISGGDYPGFPKEAAFDGDFVSTRWGSMQTGPDIKGKAWIGFDFGQGMERHIRSLRIRQGGAIASIVLGHSDNGVDWQSLPPTELIGDKNIRAYQFPPSKSARYWRLMANAALSPPSAWTVYEIQMSE